jgi:hypothetical protein
MAAIQLKPGRRYEMRVCCFDKSGQRVAAVMPALLDRADGRGWDAILAGIDIPLETCGMEISIVEDLVTQSAEQIDADLLA